MNPARSWRKPRKRAATCAPPKRRRPVCIARMAATRCFTAARAGKSAGYPYCRWVYCSKPNCQQARLAHRSTCKQGQKAAATAAAVPLPAASSASATLCACPAATAGGACASARPHPKAAPKPPPSTSASARDCCSSRAAVSARARSSANLLLARVRPPGTCICRRVGAHHLRDGQLPAMPPLWGRRSPLPPPPLPPLLPSWAHFLWVWEASPAVRG